MPSKRPRVGLLGERRVDLLGARLAGHLAHEVHDRARDHGSTNGDSVQLAVQLGNHEADRLRGAGGRGHEVRRRRPRATQVLVRAVLEVLVGGVRVDRGHDPALDSDRVVQHACHRPEAVRGAGGVRDHVVLVRVVGVVVHAQHQRHVGVGCRGADDHLLRAGGEVLRGVVALGEEAGGLDHHVGAHVAPRQCRRIALREHLQLVAVDDQAVVGEVDLALERAEDRVVLEQMRERLRVGDVVHTDPVDVRSARVRGAEDVAPDAAEAVDAGLQGHVRCFLSVASWRGEESEPQGRRGGLSTSRWTTSTRKSPRASYSLARCSAITTERWRPPVQPMPTVRWDLPSCS